MTTYVSCDIEADGPCPGLNSMLQLGAIAFDEEGKTLGEFSANLDTLVGASPDPATMQWWKEDGRWNTYLRTRGEIEQPVNAMKRMEAWVKELGRVTCVCYPASFDFPFIYYYSHRFLGSCPFSFQCLDIKSLVAGVLGVPYDKVSKRSMPREWFRNIPPHTHDAFQDAKEQGQLFLNVLKYQRERAAKATTAEVTK